MRPIKQATLHKSIDMTIKGNALFALTEKAHHPFLEDGLVVFTVGRRLLGIPASDFKLIEFLTDGVEDEDDR